MPRIHHSFPVAANSQVTVEYYGTNTAYTDSIFAGPSGAATLSNPFTVAGTTASFYLDRDWQVTCLVKSPSAAAGTPVTTAPSRDSVVVQHGMLRDQAGKVLGWYTF